MQLKLPRWLAGMAIASLTLATAHSQPAARPGFIDIFVTGHGGADMLRPALVIGDEADWASSADYPAEAKAAGQAGYATVRVSVDATGRVTGCIPEGGKAGPILERFACRVVRERGRFRYALSAKGIPIADTIELRFSFSLDSPPIPVPAPMPAPEGGYSHIPTIRLERNPDWEGFAPPGKPKGDVAVEVSIYAASYGQREYRSCLVVDSSDNKALDDATCAAIKAASYEKMEPSQTSGTTWMLVRWNDGKAQYELPSREFVTPLEIKGGTAAIRAAATPGSLRQTAWVRLAFHPGGKIECRITESTGSDDDDRKLCSNLRSNIRFTPRQDIYGRETRVVRWFSFDP